jgi:hypothetical protein
MNKKTYPSFIGRAIGLCAVVAGAFFAALVAVNIASASPSGNPPSGSGVISVSGNNVGIGTTAPAYPLSVSGSLYSVGSTPGAWSGVLGINQGSNTNYIQVDNNGNTYFASNHNANFDFAGGNVGIGTTLPTHALDVNGSANISGTLTAGAFTATLSAGNVSMGAFGSNTAGGNYSFPNNVGIGTTSPTDQLNVYSSGSAIATIETPSSLYRLIATGGINYIENGLTRTSGSAADLRFTSMNAANTWMDIAASGNVGIGTTSPGYKLDVNGDVNIETGSALRYNGQSIITAQTALSNYFFGGAGNLTMTGNYNLGGGLASLSSLTTQNYNTTWGINALHNATANNNTAVGFDALVNITTGGGNTALGLSAGRYIADGSTVNQTSANSTYLGYQTYAKANGDINETVIGSGAIGNGSNTITLGGTGTTGTIIPYGNVGIGTTAPAYTLDVSGTGRVTGAMTIGGKLTVPTVDPLYTINGINYSTYAPSMTGVNEETAGTVDLQKNADGTYSTTMNFAGAAKGSNLWLFAQATNLKNTMSQLVVSLTPSFDGNVWYTKNATANVVTIHGSAAGEVSYNFTAPRFDAAQWPNIAPADEASTTGLIIN